MSKIISLINNSSASGKTFIATALGITLSKLNKKILFVDLDPQANLTSSLDINRIKYTSYDAMIGTENFEVRKWGGNIDIIPSNINLIQCELELYNSNEREIILQKFLKQYQSQYDFIIIDSSPGLGLLTVNAIAAADMIIVPLLAKEPDYNPTKRLITALETVSKRFKTKPFETYFILNWGNSSTPMEDIKSNTTQKFHIPFFKTNILKNNYMPNEIHFLYKYDSGFSISDFYEPTQDMINLANEIINL